MRASRWLRFGLGVAIGIAGAMWFRLQDSSDAEPLRSDVTPAAQQQEGRIAEVYSLPDPARVSDPREEVIRHPRRSAWPRVPVQPEYADVRFSDVPYTLVAAFDKPQPEYALGPLRQFVVVVARDLARDALRKLIEDFRAKHADAAVLDLAVFDSVVAATHRASQAAERDPHLVAKYDRNRARETLEIGGVRVDVSSER